MAYKYNEKTGNIIDSEDGQIIASMSESATPEQAKSLVSAYNAMSNLSMDHLSKVIGCAESHISDVESGLEDGTYEAEENEDLPDLQEALASIEDWQVSLDVTSKNDASEFKPTYSAWRHGGWYVTNIQRPGGAMGCVSNNYQDGKWRIVCDDRRIDLNAPGDFTFPTRDAAARAEYDLVQAEKVRLTESQGGDPEFARSEEIKAEYLASGCQSSDVDEAVEKLMRDCKSLFSDDTYAWSFLMEEPHEDLEENDEDSQRG